MAKRKPTPRRATETAAPTAPAPADPATLEPTQVEPAPIERSVTPPVPTEARAALLLALCSAVAAGGHEIAWSRLLGRAVGHTSLGVGLALAAFMAGSGAGATVGFA